jgi:ubiquinone/menaquinone biosynthesis C-methylase UbiE
VSDPTGADRKATVGALFDTVADVYDAVVDYFGRFGRRLVEVADLRPGADVLDLACGRGAVLRPALAVVGAHGSVLGIDIAPEMVRRLGAELAPDAAPNVAVLVGDAEQLELADGSFDAVTGGFMIFFPPDPVRVLDEIRRVLRPGGRVALSVYDGPAGFPFQSELEAAVGAAPRTPGPGGRFNDAAALCVALSDAGFESVTTVELEERFTFQSLDEVERWQRSTGVRRALDSLDADQLEAYRVALALRLQPFQDGTGGFWLDQRAVAVIADIPS